MPGPLVTGGGGIRPYVLPLDAGGGRLAPGPGGTLEAVVDAQGAAVEAAPGIPPVAPLAQGARVEGMPLCGCAFDPC